MHQKEAFGKKHSGTNPAGGGIRWGGLPTFTITSDVPRTSVSIGYSLISVSMMKLIDIDRIWRSIVSLDEAVLKPQLIRPPWIATSLRDSQ